MEAIETDRVLNESLRYRIGVINSESITSKKGKRGLKLYCVAYGEASESTWNVMDEMCFFTEVLWSDWAATSFIKSCEALTLIRPSNVNTLLNLIADSALCPVNKKSPWKNSVDFYAQLQFQDNQWGRGYRIKKWGME